MAAALIAVDDLEEPGEQPQLHGQQKVDFRAKGDLWRTLSQKQLYLSDPCSVHRDQELVLSKTVLDVVAKSHRS
jgi:hypothetical protein